MLAEMLTILCQELRNWFVRERHRGTYVIKGGTLTADFLQEGQFYRIVGSVFNDGVHVYKSYTLTDETFSGEVWGMAVPQAVIELAERIAEWRKKYEGVDSAMLSPFVSESFGGYSYSKGSGQQGGMAVGSGWKSAFATELNRWRKI